MHNSKRKTLNHLLMLGIALILLSMVIPRFSAWKVRLCGLLSARRAIRRNKLCGYPL